MAGFPLGAGGGGVPGSASANSAPSPEVAAGPSKSAGAEVVGQAARPVASAYRMQLALEASIVRCVDDGMGVGQHPPPTDARQLNSEPSWVPALRRVDPPGQDAAVRAPPRKTRSAPGRLLSSTPEPGAGLGV